jgi:hypothetical protein
MTLVLSWLLLPLLGALAAPAPAHAAAVTPDTSALEFHGFRAGARLDELQALARRRAGELRCRRAKADARVTECRAVLRDATLLDAPVELWASAIDSVAGVITLSGSIADAQLDRWRDAIERHYGPVDAQVQGTQWMMQWVRRGRMLRLTWRVDHGEKLASLSLVDGRVLDAWGRARRS